MQKAFVFLLLFSTSCATVPFPPRGASQVRFDGRVDNIMRRLKAQLPPQEVWRVQYVVWSADADQELSFKNQDRVVYVNARDLTLDDDAVAFGIGHELSHIVNDAGLREALAAADMAASVGGGVAVGYYTTWWIGGLTGCGLFGCLFPPVILAISRSAEADADQFALALIGRAGYNTRHAAEVWCGKFEEDDRIKGLLGENPGSALSTHPSGKERCAAMREALNNRSR